MSRLKMYDGGDWVDVGPDAAEIQGLISDAIADDETLVQAAAAAVDAEPRISVLNAAVERAIPDSPLSPGQRVNWDEDDNPFVQDDKIFSPDQFGGAGDGSTNDGVALEKMFTAITNAGGGRFSLLGREWWSDRPLEIDVPVVMEGAQVGSWNATTLPILGVLRFEAGIDGLTLGPNAQTSVLKRIGINSQTYIEEGPYEGHGLRIQGKRWRMEQVVVRGFGEHGFFFDGNLVADGTNANLGNATLCRATLNAEDGYYINRQDANVYTFETCDATNNGRYGFNNEGLLRNNFIGCHAAFNAEGDYRERGNGAMWLNPYSEGGGKFIIDNGSDGGVLIMPGSHEAPELWYGSEGSYTNAPAADPLYIRDWYVLRDNRLITTLRMKGVVSGGEYTLSIDRSASGQLMLLDDTNSERVFVVAPGAPPTLQIECLLRMMEGNDIRLGTTTGTKIGTSTSQKLGFYNATPVVQPSVTGATDTDKLTSLISALDTLGLIDDQTT